MLRIWVPVAVVSLLAACSSVPPQSASRSASGMKITTPRAFPAPANFPKFVDHSVGQEEISIQAMSLVGVPYRWGGNTPTSGFDCSGLVRYVIGRAADVNLPRTTADMSGRGVSVEPDEIAPGDLIFFNTTGRPHSHVGIYVGKLRFVNAPSTGGTVRLDYLTNPYWAKRFDGIRRVAPPRSAPTPFDAPTYEAKRDEPRNPPAVAAAPVVVTAAVAQRQPAYAASQAKATQAPAIPSTPIVTAAAAAPAAPAADPYEPPPPRMQAAQQQATSVNDGATAMTANAAPAAPAEVGTQIPTTALTAAQAAAFDAEPPPATASAPTRSIEAAPVQVLRASTQSAPVSPRTSTADDPIARFATGSY
ncbi:MULTISPECIES: C40 family peptidase [Burkholderia cepacia complex]|uniref:C40 family peptidase n=1 Tax=Burkholderia cepacia complex TaxID=87882 RepID=UPI00098F28E4|nr:MULTISPECIES: C40 family peptidase [Burkholderia cepacia complex]AQT50287.1 hydrolase Nlp/P60 [Burkholderia cenocepacia]MBJ9729366.1 C40 family peptidase [Burkholderia cenocepacia]MBR8396348.1 C40 family peptidase [Burkholderia cenocepacia]MDN7530899.1 C40 family peptidase [Burkholderia orbicola]UJH72042.1 C40 family peptidase [Burkholderia cenocepacia]